MKRCPLCGASPSSSDVFCEADGVRLEEGAPSGATSPRAPCPNCRQGNVEAGRSCSSCGYRGAATGEIASNANAVRGWPVALPVGTPLAGGAVISSRDGEHVVSRPGGSVRVAMGHAAAVEYEAQLLERIGGTGPFPRLFGRGVDDVHGSHLVLDEVPSDARAIAEIGPSLDLPGALGVVGRLIDAAERVERAGYAWDLRRADLYVRPDGSILLSRVRVPRRLRGGERLDMRLLVETIGACLVPSPALDGPTCVFRLLLPHVPMRGEPGRSIDDARAELAASAREVAAPLDDSAPAAGVCDPGLRRPHNEDAFAFATGTTRGEPWAVLVVCDGVSSSSNAEQASALAAKTACDVLASAMHSGDMAGDAEAGAMAAAVRAAHVTVCTHAIAAVEGAPPGTTIVAALVLRRRLTVGWVGDSRAYWVSHDGAELMTRDHSWVTETVTRGEATEEQAMHSPLAHALTRCLGPLEGDDSEDGGGGARRIVEVEPEVRTRELPGSGWVVLCTDGFWNYFPSASAVSSLVLEVAGWAPARIARRLVNQALACGGHDNTTVVVYRHD